MTEAIAVLRAEREEARVRLITAMREFDYEIALDDKPTMKNMAMILEAIDAKLTRLNERVSFLEPYKED